MKSTCHPTCTPGYAHASRSSQPHRSHTGGPQGRPLPEQALLASGLTERAAAVSRKLENSLFTAARLEIRPSGQALPQETPATARDGAADKFSTAYPQVSAPSRPFAKQQPATSRSTLAPDPPPPNQPTDAPSIGHALGLPQRRNSSLRASAPTAESGEPAPEERAPGAARPAAQFSEASRSRTGVAAETTSSDFVESTRPDRLPAPALPGHARDAAANSLETRTSGGEMTALSQPAPKPGPNPLLMPRAASSSSSAAEGAETVERFVELAALQRQSGSGQMNILLRDSRLGLLSLRLVERAGLIDTIIRSDNPRTGTLINDTLPQLIESLAGRGLQAQAAAQSNGSASYGDPHQQQQGGRRQQRSFRPKQHIGRQARSFQLEVERGG